jgi:hypothetical protein
MPSSDERTTNDRPQDRAPWDDAEKPASDSTEQVEEVEETSTLDAPSSPEPSWRPEAPAWDRPTPRSESMPSGMGGPMDEAMTRPATTRTRRSTAARKAATAATAKAATRKRTVAS